MWSVVLSPAPEQHHADVEDWRAAQSGGSSCPIDQAITSAALADRLGYAFAAGYSAALVALLAGRGPAPVFGRVTLAATEAGGAHPRAVQTTLRRTTHGLILDGQKRWLTLGPGAQTLLVVARWPGEPGEAHPRLVVARVDAARAGLHLRPLPAAPFVPEIPHAELTLEGVEVAEEEILPGDGYADYLKPFRTVEDLHVHAALLAWLVAQGARLSWPKDQVEELCALLASARALARDDPRSPAVHVALGGLLRLTERAVAGLEPCWSAADAERRQRWARDRPLLAVAAAARGQRLARAWAAVGSAT